MISRTHQNDVTDTQLWCHGHTKEMPWAHTCDVMDTLHTTVMSWTHTQMWCHGHITNCDVMDIPQGDVTDTRLWYYGHTRQLCHAHTTVMSLTHHSDVTDTPQWCHWQWCQGHTIQTTVMSLTVMSWTHHSNVMDTPDSYVMKTPQWCLGHTTVMSRTPQWCHGHTTVMS